MTVQFNYNNAKKNSHNVVLFVDEKFNILALKKYILSKEYSFIEDLLKITDFNKQIVPIDINSKKKIILVSLKKNLSNSEAETLGAKFYDQFKDLKQTDYSINTETIPNKSKNLLGYFLHGLKLKSYKFEKYKSKKIKKYYLYMLLVKIRYLQRIRLSLKL